MRPPQQHQQHDARTSRSPTRAEQGQQIAYLCTPGPGPGAKGPPSSSPCVQHRHQPQAGRLLLCCRRKRASHCRPHCSSARPQCTMGFQSRPCVLARRGPGTSHRPASLPHCCPGLCSRPRLWAPVTRPTWHIPLIPPAGEPSFSLASREICSPDLPPNPKQPTPSAAASTPHLLAPPAAPPAPSIRSCIAFSSVSRAMAQRAACLRSTKSRLARGWWGSSVDQQSCLNPSTNPGGTIRWL